MSDVSWSETVKLGRQRAQELAAAGPQQGPAGDAVEASEKDGDAREAVEKARDAAAASASAAAAPAAAPAAAGAAADSQEEEALPPPPVPTYRGTTYNRAKQGWSSKFWIVTERKNRRAPRLVDCEWLLLTWLLHPCAV